MGHGSKDDHSDDEQYLELKQQHQNEVLFFRLGDFYEMFLDDAARFSKLLTSPSPNATACRCAAFPYHAAKNYIKRLLEEGKKIAHCEQVEMPGPDRAIARREVVQVITPGTVVEDEFLDAGTNNHILAVSLHKRHVACALCELSSGIMNLVSLPEDTRFESLRSLFEELSPREMLVNG